MKRSRKEIEDMYSFLSWASHFNTNGSRQTEIAINNIQCAIDEVEQEMDEILSLQMDKEHWYNESERLKEENEILRNDLKELSKFVYGKES